jgi:hypothetical protein
MDARSDRSFRLKHDSTGRAVVQVPATAPSADEEAGTGREILCSRCRNPITASAYQVRIDGAHEHSKTNPLGLTYAFRCFSSASGCRVIVAPTREDTWFDAHAWQLAHCGACLTHLGWYFTGPSAFFALISERLIEDDGHG